MSLATATAELTFDRTLPRELAHRRAVGEVFVTDSAAAGTDRFLVAAQIPPSHALWGDHPRTHHDPLAIVEASRQATFVIMHRHLDVPPGPPFILRGIDIRVLDLDAFAVVAGRPLEGVFRFALTDKDRQAETLTGVSFTATFAIGETDALSISGGVSFLRQPDYEAMRAFGRARKKLGDGRPDPPAPIEPALRSRSWPANVVVGDPAADLDDPGVPVIVDERHPSFYDHPQDHVPGPLLLEACRQAGIAAALRAGAFTTPRAALTACACEFTDFAEPEAPLRCSAVVEDVTDREATIAAGLHQLGTQIGTATLSVRELP